MTEISIPTRMWVEYQLDGVIQSSKTLHGGTSSDMTCLEIETRNVIEKVILREYTDEKWLETEPDIALQEAENLDQAEKLSVTTPKLIAFDHKGEVATFPSLLMSKVDGQVNLKPRNLEKWIGQLAQTLVRIHQLEDPKVTHQYFRYFDPDISVNPDWSTKPENWKQTFHYLKTAQRPDYIPTFIHRDYHPTNVLFNNEEISAVVDWTDSCIGPKQMDIAHCRWNLAMIYGQDTADLFLQAYMTHDPSLQYNSYWDLEASGNVFTEERPEVYGGWQTFGLTDITEDLIIKRMDQFLAQALDKIKS